MSTEKIQLRYWIKGWFILFIGKLQGKSNNEIIDEQMAKYREEHESEDRVAVAKIEDKIEKMKRGEE